ncbi:hypothetical protein [Shinella sp. JR1-6]|uniref:hypothetical protein n=1 Tax=Shinella sp. JR1-6 TaxID=2527671 RepID=UPI00102D66D7|nr:hypothetical protein [Shinella sp. JR1-6]TAA61622.1 hypothetical protein EXZ48_10755 [Shinella sp. JR1-6]
MLHKINEHSMLRTLLTNEERMLASILCETEQNVRAMCRVMQVYDQYGMDRPLREDTLDELQAVFSAFYTYVDTQMDAISDLARTLEDDFEWVSLEALRASDDFRRDGHDASPSMAPVYGE